MQAPTRREFLKQAGSALALAVAPISGGGRRPNVLFLAVDDLRPALGCYGDLAAATPHIDSLAARGVRFTRAYCQQSVCNPSRQSLLTGRRPDSIRVWDLKTHFRHTTPGAVTLPEHFRNHGYFARSFGKIFHGEAPMADPASWSVPEEFQYTPKRDDYILPRNHVARIAQKAEATEFEDASDDAYPDGEVAAAAVRALAGFAAEPGGKPFFLAAGFRKPHLPFTAPRGYWDRQRPVPPPARALPPDGAPAVALHNSVELRGYLGIPHAGPLPPELIDQLRRGYYASLSYTDAQIGRVLAELRRTGLDRSTIVVLWADHGFHLGEHGLWAKTTNYEADTRVPLIIARPDERRGGSSCASLVELLDLFPTLCELAGVAAPAGLEGTSLRPCLDDPTRSVRAAALSQFPRPWFYRPVPEFMGYAVRTDTHRYVEWRRFGTRDVTARELYRYDPGQEFESVNLAGDPAEARRMRELAALI